MFIEKKAPPDGRDPGARYVEKRGEKKIKGVDGTKMGEDILNPRLPEDDVQEQAADAKFQENQE
jgi:hypothetical protein